MIALPPGIPVVLAEEYADLGAGMCLASPPQVYRCERLPELTRRGLEVLRALVAASDSAPLGATGGALCRTLTMRRRSLDGWLGQLRGHCLITRAPGTTVRYQPTDLGRRLARAT